MTEPSFWVGTSWKMNNMLAEATSFTRALAMADDKRDARIQVIPPFKAIREVKQILAETSVKVDGLFIGRSAWNVEGYIDILGRCAAVIRTL